MKNLRQIKDLINNIGKEKNINAQILLRNYMLERLLERISLSEFKDKFILKGGMLVAAIVGVDIRSTIDMDATIKSYPITIESINSIFDAILSGKTFAPGAGKIPAFQQGMFYNITVNRIFI